MIFPGMTIMKILFVDIVRRFAKRFPALLSLFEARLSPPAPVRGYSVR
jgi:hypothetical protein